MAAKATVTVKGKVLGLMQKAKSTKERATEYFPRIKKSIYFDKIVSLEEDIANKQSLIFDLENMSLATNHNKGIIALTKEDVQARVEQMIELDEEIILLNLKLNARKQSFVKYLGDLPTV